MDKLVKNERTGLKFALVKTIHFQIKPISVSGRNIIKQRIAASIISKKEIDKIIKSGVLQLSAFSSAFTAGATASFFLFFMSFGIR